MRFTETINGYNAMGREDAEYEACYTVTEHHTISGLHCHDCLLYTSPSPRD